MPDVVSLDTVTHDLRGLLSELPLGDTVTLADDQGKPVALLVSLQAESSNGTQKSLDHSEWMERWDALAKEVEKAWQGEKSALEELTEMRR
jgi:antitoxin (DNA-binding transcriptional repressor) of toxin-antitoxin stability system